MHFSIFQKYKLKSKYFYNYTVITMLRSCTTIIVNKLSHRGCGILNFINHSHTTSTEASTEAEEPKKTESKRLAEFRKKIRETTPINDLGEQPEFDPNAKEDPLPAWPDNTNPHTGEVGGPKGPEPTRYGDWERKGRVTDF